MERCLLSTIPSATTADSNDSILARIAIVNAGLIKSLISPKLTCGIVIPGKLDETVYKSPIVVTFKPPAFTTAVAIIMAINEPGIAFTYFSFAGSSFISIGQKIWIRSAPTPTARVTQFNLVIFLPRAPTFSMNSDGSAPISMPIKSLICPTTNVTAIPAVNPVVIVYGIYLIRLPTLNNPNTIIIIPAIIVATTRPDVPYCWIIP